MINFLFREPDPDPETDPNPNPYLNPDPDPDLGLGLDLGQTLPSGLPRTERQLTGYQTMAWKIGSPLRACPGGSDDTFTPYSLPAECQMSRHFRTGASPTEICDETMCGTMSPEGEVTIRKTYRRCKQSTQTI